MSDIVTKVHAKKGDQSGLDALNKGIDELKQKEATASAVEKEATKATREATKAKNEKAKAIGLLSMLFPRISGQLRILQVAIKGASFVRWLSVVGALVSLGAVVYSKFFAPMIEGARKSKAALAEWIGMASGVDSIIAKHEAAISKIDGVAAAYNAAATAARRLSDAQDRLDDAKAQARIDVMPEGSAKEEATLQQNLRVNSRDDNKLTATRDDEFRRDISAQDKLLALVKARNAAAALLKKEFTASIESGQKSNEQAALTEVARFKAGQITREGFIEKHGETPEQMRERAIQKINSGNITYAEHTDDNKAIRDAAAGFVKLSNEVNKAVEDFKNLRTEIDANIKALGVEKETLAVEKQALIQKEDKDALASIQKQIDAWIKADDEKREKRSKELGEAQEKKEKIDQEDIAKAEQARKERAFNKLAPELQLDALAQDVADAIKVRSEHLKSGNKGAAARVDYEITQMRNQYDDIKSGIKKPEIKPGETGFDAFLGDAAESRQDMLSGTKMARSFRSRLNKTGFGEVGESFSKKLIRGQLNSGEIRTEMSRGGADRDTLLKEENNALLREIRDKIGMRE